MKRPLVILTSIFCLGVFISEIASFFILFVSALALVNIIICLIFFKSKLAGIFILLLIFSLGLAHSSTSRIFPRSHISRIGFYNGAEPYKVQGFICNQPQIKYGRTTFLFRAKEIEFNRFKQNACGDILVYVQGALDLCYGQDLVLRGSLSRPYFNRRNAYVLMRVKSAQDVIRLNKNSGFAFKRFALWLKSEIEKIIFRHTSVLTAGVIDAMLLGEKRNIPPLLYQSMMQTGTVHILVVSGFNVGLVGFVIFLSLKFLRIKRRVRSLLVIPVLLIYCLMTGVSAPVVRATIMGIFFIIGSLVKREPDIYNSLSLAALFILAINPQELFSISFQLSFISVISIVYIYPRFKSFLRIETLKIKFIRFITNSFLVSFSAWVGTMGLIAYNFKMFSPVTILANILIVPLATLITLCGLSLVFISLALPSLAPLFAASCEFLVSLLININAFLVHLPGAYLCW